MSRFTETLDRNRILAAGWEIDSFSAINDAGEIKSAIEITKVTSGSYASIQIALSADEMREFAKCLNKTADRIDALHAAEKAAA